MMISTKMQNTPPICPLCGQPNPVKLEIPGVNGLHQCRSCSFIFAPGIQSEDSALYDSHFGDTNVHPTYEKRDGEYVGRNVDRLNELLDIAEPYKQTGAILDVGCSAAFFLHQARQRDWRAQGAEIAGWAVEFSRKELGLDVFHGVLQDAKFPDACFDVVFSSHVMEHILDPLSLLREMARVLRPGGAHITVVPTQMASPSWRLAGRFYGDAPPIHASYYTRRTFRVFCEKAGLRFKSCQYNVELSRLRDLLGSEQQAMTRWQHRKNGVLAGTSEKISRSAWVAPVKRLVNWGGNLLGMGDEMLVIAEKPLHPPPAP